MIWRRVLAAKRRVIWPLATAVIANLALLALVLYPLAKKVAGGEQAAQAAAAELAAARRDHAMARATVSGKEMADTALRQFYSSVLPPDLSGARRSMSKIDQLLARSNLQRGRADMQPEEVRDSQLAKLTVDVDFSGSYADVRRFIYAVETSPEFMVVENIELAQEQDGKPGLRVRATIATYFRAGGDGN